MTDQPPGYPPPPRDYGYQGYGGYQGYQGYQGYGDVGGYGDYPGYQGYQPPQPSGYLPAGYGYPPPPPGYGYPVVRGTNGMATASLICSLIGWFCGIGLLLGVIFGFVSLSQIKRTGEEGRGMAIAGIIIGVAPIAFAIVFYLVLAIIWGVSS